MRYVGNCTSFRGESHKKSDKPCQDSSSFLCTNEFAAVAVADGHGGAPHYLSQVGSSIAVDVAMLEIDKMMSDSKFENKLKNDEDGIIEQLKNNIVSRWRLRTKHDSGLYDKRICSEIENSDIRLYGTTLICGILGEDFVIGIQLGDGDFVTVDQNGKTNSTFIPPDENCHDNITTSLCDECPQLEMRTSIQYFNTEIIKDFIRELKKLKDETYSDASIESVKKILTEMQHNISVDNLYQYVKKINKKKPEESYENYCKNINKKLVENSVSEKYRKKFCELIQTKTVDDAIIEIRKEVPDRIASIDRIIDVAKNIPKTERKALFSSMVRTVDYYNSLIPVAISASSDGFGTTFQKNKVGEQTSLILSLMSDCDQWYDAICPYIEECTHHGNEDDTSFSIVCRFSSVDFKKLYEDNFGEDFPFLYIKNKYSLNQKVVNSGKIIDGDVFETGTLRMNEECQISEVTKYPTWCFEYEPSYDYKMKNGALSELSFRVRSRDKASKYVLRYIGDFERTNKTGFGREYITYPGCDYELIFYEGEFLNNCWQGNGKKYHKGDSVEDSNGISRFTSVLSYKGEYKNNLKNGIGRNYSNGSPIVCGRFSNNEINEVI